MNIDWKYKRMYLAIAFLIFFVFVAFLLIIHSLSPTYDDILISSVEKGADKSILIATIEKHTEVEMNYYKSLLEAEIAKTQYEYKTGALTQEEMDFELKKAQNDYNITMTTLPKIESVRKQYIYGNISKKEFLKQLEEFKSVSETIKEDLERH